MGVDTGLNPFEHSMYPALGLCTKLCCVLHADGKSSSSPSASTCNQHGDIVRKSYLPTVAKTTFLPSKASSAEIPSLGTLLKQTTRSKPTNKLISKSPRSMRMANTFSKIYGSAPCSVTLSYGQLYGLEGYQEKEKMTKSLMADDSTHQPGCWV